MDKVSPKLGCFLYIQLGCGYTNFRLSCFD